MKIKSYDMFDTLVARKCISYEAIFDEMAKITNQPNFKDVRRQSEAELYGKHFTFDDIYENMKNHLGEFDKLWSMRMVNEFKMDVWNPDSIINCLKKLELEEERKNLIPIKENIDKLRPGDIIVSDMYLSPDFLQEFLPRFVTIIVTPNGKATGSIWEELKKHYDIECHIGDNPHSDVKTAEENGIATQLSTESVLTQNETLVAQYSQSLSKIMRELRLRTFNEDPTHRTLENLETQINIPLLLLMCEHISREAKADNYTNILISGRDGEKLSKLMNLREGYSIGSNRMNISYFWTSRMSRKTASDDYLSYVNSLVNNQKTLIVDLDGTGWTLRHLKDQMEKKYPTANSLIGLYLFHYLDEANLPGFMPRPHSVTNYDIKNAFFTNKFQHNRLELINLTNHPMIADVKKVCNNYVPVFFDSGHDDETITYVNTMDEIFNQLFAYIDSTVFEEIHKINDQDLITLMDSIYSNLSSYPQDVFDVLERQQREEEKSIEDKLKE